MRQGVCAYVCTAFALASAWCSLGRATHHTWWIDQVFSNASGSIQFIELYNDFSDENYVGGYQISSNAKTFTFPNDLKITEETAEHFFLIATAGFNALHGVPTPDFTVPNNFFNPSGDMLNYADVNSITWTAGQLPTDGIHALFRDPDPPNAESIGVNLATNLIGESAFAPEPNSAVLLLLFSCGVAMRGLRRRVTSSRAEGRTRR